MSKSNSFNSNLCLYSYHCKFSNSLCNYCVLLIRVYNIEYLAINFDYRLKFVEHIKLFYKFKILHNILDLKF